MGHVVDNIALGCNIRGARRTQGLTQEALADASEVSVRTIRELERGNGDPKLETVARLLSALGLTYDEALSQRPRLKLYRQRAAET